MGGLCPSEDSENDRPVDNNTGGGGGGNTKPDDKPEDNTGGGNSGNNEDEEEPPAGGGDLEEKVPKPAGVVIRREIRSMSSSDQNRFFDAVDEMLKNKSGRGTSEFYRLASYHGQPAPIYCEHGRETFPGWHRIYLMDFELALQAADRKLGNDGQISLPYWDWTKNQSDGLPKIIRDRFNGWPDDFWPDGVNQGALSRASDSQIGRQLVSWNLATEARDCLLATQHWVHASTRFRGSYPSIETPHNSIHVIVGGSGGQMGGVAWAAFDITFWLHHNNVDRIYESYLEIEPDSAQEFENFQDNQDTDMFDRNFEPFRKDNGDRWRPEDTFNTEKLGYKFDELFKPPAQQLREPPTVVLFSQVKVYEFESKCYQLHCFIIDGDQKDEWKEPSTIDDIDYDSPNYAGGAGVFGRGMECRNCMNRPPQDIVIDITKTLRDLGINRYKAVAKVYILETTTNSPNLIPRSDTPLPEPIITGPLFVNKSSDKSCSNEDKDNNDKNDVIALQRYLQKFGYYAPERKIDGDYGDYTKQAVMDFQTATGDLKVDGIVGPKTKEAIIDKKRCDNLDPFAKNDVTDIQIDGIDYVGKETEIKYYIATQPGYLTKDDCRRAISSACEQYDKVTSLKFIEVSDEKECNIKFSWTQFNSENDPMRFDGPGGVLGRGGKGYVEFDTAERWNIGVTDDDKKELSDLFDPKTWYRGQATVSLYYTALHELGHSLGLDHSVNANDVMSPWYNTAQTELSKNDIERIKKITGDA